MPGQQGSYPFDQWQRKKSNIHIRTALQHIYKDQVDNRRRYMDDMNDFSRIFTTSQFISQPPPPRTNVELLGQNHSACMHDGYIELIHGVFPSLLFQGNNKCLFFLYKATHSSKTGGINRKMSAFAAPLRAMKEY